MINENFFRFSDAFKNEYDSKLAIELDQLRSKTTMEIEKLRDGIKEMYERENRCVEMEKISLRR